MALQISGLHFKFGLTFPVAHAARAYSSFCSMKVFSIVPGYDDSSLQGYPSIKFAGTHLFTWVETGSVRVQCLVQEHNTVTVARIPTSMA